MKCVALCLVLLATLTGSKADKGLGDIINGLVEIMPMDDLQNWLIEKYTGDVDFQTLVKYLGSDHFRKIDDHILDHQWQYDFILWLESEGLTVISTMNTVRELLGLPAYHPPTVVSITKFEKPDIEWELLHLIEEVGKILEPHAEEIKAYWESVKDEPKLAELLEKLKSDDCKEFAVDYVYEFQEFKEFIELLKDGNLPMDEILEGIYNSLWGSVLRQLFQLKH